MKKPGKSPPGKTSTRKSGLTDEDAALWDFVTSSVTRLERKRTSHARGSRDETSEPHKPAPADRSRTERSAPDPHSKRNVPPPRAPEPREFDRREARHLARGRIEIEARIDLHGLRQNDAHRRLLSFLHRAQQEGLRHVLVITGKGGFDESHHTLPFHETPDRAPRGVLRRSVPLWLEEQSLSGVVLSFREAATHHGGTGALYVRLRSASRRR